MLYAMQCRNSLDSNKAYQIRVTRCKERCRIGLKFVSTHDVILPNTASHVVLAPRYLGSMDNIGQPASLPHVHVVAEQIRWSTTPPDERSALQTLGRDFIKRLITTRPELGVRKVKQKPQGRERVTAVVRGASRKNDLPQLREQHLLL